MRNWNQLILRLPWTLKNCPRFLKDGGVQIWEGGGEGEGGEPYLRSKQTTVNSSEVLNSVIESISNGGRRLLDSERIGMFPSPKSLQERLNELRRPAVELK